eukprot:2552547-Rhodomonas_salina.3
MPAPGRNTDIPTNLAQDRSLQTPVFHQQPSRICRFPGLPQCSTSCLGVPGAEGVRCASVGKS